MLRSCLCRGAIIIIIIMFYCLSCTEVRQNTHSTRGTEDTTFICVLKGFSAFAVPNAPPPLHFTIPAFHR